MVRMFVVLVLASSCSVALMETEDPAIDVVHHDPHCTGTKGYGAWDLLDAAVVGGLGVYVASKEDASAVAYVIPVAAGVAYIGSAIYGFGAAEKCKELRRRRDVVNGNIADRIQMLSKAEMDREKAEKKAKEAAPVPDAGVPVVDGGVDAGPVE